jgi:hypothetical protein
MKNAEKRPSRPKRSSLGHKQVDLSLSKIRSAVTNGSQVILGCDHRSARMRRLKNLIGGHVADLGSRDLISEAQFCIVRRAALLTLELELMEVKFEANHGANGQELDAYQRASS